MADTENQKQDSQSPASQKEKAGQATKPEKQSGKTAVPKAGMLAASAGPSGDAAGKSRAGVGVVFGLLLLGGAVAAGYYASRQWTQNWQQVQAWRGEVEQRLTMLEQVDVAASRTQAVTGKAESVASEKSGGIAPQELTALTSQLQVLQQAQEALQASMQTLQSRPRSTSTEETAALLDTLQKQDATIARLRAESGRLAAELQALQQRFDGLATGSLRDVPLILLFDQLDKAVADGQPYQLLLVRMQGYGERVEGLAEILSALQPHAEAGVIARRELRQQWLQQLTDWVVRLRRGRDESAWAGVKEQLDKLVKIRQITPDADDTSPESTLARADKLLQEERWEEALTLLKSDSRLEEEKALQSWVGQLALRLEIDTMMARLQQLLARQTHSPDAVPQPVGEAG